MIEQINYRGAAYFSFNTFRDILDKSRTKYFELEGYSNEIGKLVSMTRTDENEHFFEEVHAKLCAFDGFGEELSIESFEEFSGNFVIKLITPPIASEP